MQNKFWPYALLRLIISDLTSLTSTKHCLILTGVIFFRQIVYVNNCPHLHAWIVGHV